MQPSEHTDVELAERLQAGDNAAFDELMRRYQRPVMNFVYRMLGDAAEAEDVAQEVFVRLYRKIGSYRPETKFSTWLFALARNAGIDRLRWRKRHPQDSLEALEEHAGASPVAAPGGVGEEVQAREIGEQIAAAIAILPEDQKTALILSEYHGLAYEEIAQIMNCSPKSVEGRLYRAKQTLRKRLEFLRE
jgi:RNA polymerase sigma-70 factor (ECF subfamily)